MSESNAIATINSMEGFQRLAQFSTSAAAKAAAQGTAYSKSEVYKQLLVLQQGQQAGE